jgi:hypothetical protein
LEAETVRFRTPASITLPNDAARNFPFPSGLAVARAWKFTLLEF